MRSVLAPLAFAVAFLTAGCSSTPTYPPRIADSDAESLNLAHAGGGGTPRPEGGFAVETDDDAGASGTVDASDERGDPCVALESCCVSPAFPDVSVTGCELTTAGGSAAECSAALASYRGSQYCP